LSSLLYKFIVNDITNNGKTYHWFENVRSILYECNLGHVWESQHFTGSRSALLSILEHMLKTNYIETWKNDVYSSPKCIYYRIFKTQHELESYLCNLPEKYVNCLVNYRMCNNRLPIETGRWVGLERNQRVCNLCNNGDIGDEFHYIFRCSYFSVKRKHYIGFSNLTDANTSDFASIMCNQDINILSKLCIFVNIVMQHIRRPPG